MATYWLLTVTYWLPTYVIADINECEEGTHNCDGNARCINTWQGFMCACDPGYTGSGVAGDCTGETV